VGCSCSRTEVLLAGQAGRHERRSDPSPESRAQPLRRHLQLRSPDLVFLIPADTASDLILTPRYSTVVRLRGFVRYAPRSWA
jgi:hypothetical protein